MQLLLDIWRTREETIENAMTDPIKYGFDLKPWADADAILEAFPELWCFGGNRSAKTTYGARTVVKAAMENPDGLIWCFAQDDNASKTIQQRAVYEWLPAELKKNTKTDRGYIKYSLKNGFTGKSLIMPDTGTQIQFHTYSAFQANPSKFEGYKTGSYDPKFINIGIWLDEYLLGPELVDTLRYRLADFDARMLGTFTPIDGVTEFVDSIIKGAEWEETKEILKEHFPEHAGRKVPYIQRSRTRNAKMIYFHSHWNPFGGWKRIQADLKGRPLDEILTRFYGVATKVMKKQFPMFQTDVNVKPHEEIMEVVRVDSKVTRYMIIDPAPNKRWFMLWIAVDRDGDWYVYREWPDKSYGDWAEVGKNNKSRYGPASDPDGKGITGYIELIEELERGEKIYERLMDPRMGNTPKQIKDGTATIIDQLADQGMDVVPAAGGHRIHGLSKVREQMAYNIELPIDSVNRPRFWISDTCENTIDSLHNYTAQESEDKDAWSDPIDCLMYAGASDIYYLDHLKPTKTRQGTGGY